jgi:hypothetical protein
MAPLRLGGRSNWLTGHRRAGLAQEDPPRMSALIDTHRGVLRAICDTPYGFFGRKASDMGIDQLRAGGWKLIQLWLGFVRCDVASVLVSHSSVASATHVSDPIEECSTSVAALSLTPTMRKPRTAWTM